MLLNAFRFVLVVDVELHQPAHSDFYTIVMMFLMCCISFSKGLLTGEEGAAAFQSKSKKSEPKVPSIKDYTEYHTDTTVHFKVTLSDEQMAAAESIGCVKIIEATYAYVQ